MQGVPIKVHSRLNIALPVVTKPYGAAPGAAPPGFASTGDPMFNRLWTLLGPPCINVPGLADQHGLPLGVQIVGRFARDRTALEAAWFLERALA